MIREGKLVCDACRSDISRVTAVPPEGWPTLHCLCSSCFAALWKQSIVRA